MKKLFLFIALVLGSMAAPAQAPPRSVLQWDMAPEIDSAHLVLNVSLGGGRYYDTVHNMISADVYLEVAAPGATFLVDSAQLDPAGGNYNDHLVLVRIHNINQGGAYSMRKFNQWKGTTEVWRFTINRNSTQADFKKDVQVPVFRVSIPYQGSLKKGAIIRFRTMRTRGHPMLSEWSTWGKYNQVVAGSAVLLLDNR